MADEGLPRCFIAMPISVRAEHKERYGDPLHFKHVLDYLFTPAVEAAGYEPVPPTVDGSAHITASIVASLTDCDLVLVDMSTLNANVFMELGIRTALGRPVALVRDEHLIDLPFDIQSLDSPTYSSALHLWEHEDEVAQLAAHIKLAGSRGDENELWRHYSPSRTGSAPTPLDAEETISLRLEELSAQVRRLDERMQPTADNIFGPEVIARRLDRTPPLSHMPWGRLVVGRGGGPEMTSKDTSALLSSLRKADVLMGPVIGSHRRGNELWISLDGWDATQDVALSTWLADHPELEARIVLEAT